MFTRPGIFTNFLQMAIPILLPELAAETLGTLAPAARNSSQICAWRFCKVTVTWPWDSTWDLYMGPGLDLWFSAKYGLNMG